MEGKLQVYKSMEEAKVSGRGGAFGKIREQTLKLIPKGQTALLSDVIKFLNIDVKDSQQKYTYARNALKPWLHKHNERVFVTPE